MPRRPQLFVVALACCGGGCQAYDRVAYHALIQGAHDAAADATGFDARDDVVGTDAVDVVAADVVANDVVATDTTGAADVVDASDVPTPTDVPNDAPLVNLTLNPSFETTTSPWNGFQSRLSRVARTDAPNGNYVVQVDANTPDGGTGLYTVDDGSTSVPAIVPGQTYVATAWMRAATAQSLGVHAFIAIRQNSTSGIGPAVNSPAVTLSDTFQSASVRVTTTAGYSTLTVYAASTGSPGSAFQADEITVVRVGP